MICEHCARMSELEEENRQLRRELAHELDVYQATKLSVELSLTPQEANLLSALYDANRRPLSVYQLTEILPPSGPKERSDDSKTSSVLICRLRKKLGRDFVENVWGRGHRLSVAGRAHLDVILTQPDQVAA